MPFSSSGLLLRCRSCIYAAVAAVITHAGNVDVVVHHFRAVYVVNFRHIDIVHRAVVVEASAIPASTLISAAKISVAVTDPAVKTYHRPPISFVKYKSGTAPAPIARSPQKTNLRRQYPSSRHPVVVFVVGIPGPITWGPDIPLTRANWLGVYRQLWRWKAHRNADTHLRGGGRWQYGCQRQHRHHSYQQANCIRDTHFPSSARSSFLILSRCGRPELSGFVGLFWSQNVALQTPLFP